MYRDKDQLLLEKKYLFMISEDAQNAMAELGSYLKKINTNFKPLGIDELEFKQPENYKRWMQQVNMMFRQAYSALIHLPFITKIEYSKKLDSPQLEVYGDLLNIGEDELIGNVYIVRGGEGTPTDFGGQGLYITPQLDFHRQY